MHLMADVLYVRGHRAVANVPASCPALWSALLSCCAGASLRNDIGVVTTHEVALSNVG